MRSGSRPMASTLSTTAGRILRISAPVEGSKLTSQTSSRCGSFAFAMQIVLTEGLERGQLGVGAVVMFGRGRGCGENGVPFRLREPTQFCRCPDVFATVCYRLAHDLSSLH